jgi:creatinine amidohydrolase
VTGFQFADLTSAQVDALPTADRQPVLLLPVGVVEPHGPHAPLSTDTIISAGMCERAAQRLADDPNLRVLILPPLPYGVTRYSAMFRGAVSISQETLHALVMEVCVSLVDQGFRHLVVVNNHFEPEHVATLRHAVATVNAEHGDPIGYLDLVRRRNVARLTEEFRSGASHAGRYETSLVLADHPELVDTDVMRELPEVPTDLAHAINEGQKDFLAMGMDRAYSGAPAKATPEEGLSTFDTLTEMLVEVIREVAGRR